MIERLLKALGVSDAPSPHADDLNAVAPRRERVSLAQDAFLVAIDPEKGGLSDGVRGAVAAALLVELAHERRIEVSVETRATRMTLVQPSPFGDPELDVAMKVIDAGGAGQKVTSEVRLLAANAGLIRDRLIGEGLVVEEAERRFGLRTVERLRPTPASGRDELVARLRSVLVGESTPDERTALLIAVLDKFVPLKLVVAKDEVKEARRRAGTISEGLGADARALISAARSVDGRGGDYASGV